jgi:organic hydroperoxide reductase OsmC/OhrA
VSFSFKEGAMTTHQAALFWSREGTDFLAQHYSRRHEWRFDGGARVSASSSPQVVPVPWSDPSAVDPEEALVASVSSCHMLWFLSIAAKAGWVVDRYTDAATGLMARNEQGRQAITRIILRPEVQFAPGLQPSCSEIDAMHHEAHEACFIANSLKSEIRCEPVCSS